MSKNIQAFTKEQSQKIEAVAEKHYKQITKGLSTLKLYKAYLSTMEHNINNKLHDDEVENIISLIMEQIEPTQILLSETGSNGSTLLEEQ